MATITVRALNPITWDPQQGNGQANFLSDLDAMVQIIATRLRLYQGEWFLNLLDGLPMFQSILGSSGGSTNIQAVVNLIAQRISTTVYVTAINSISASYSPSNRVFSFKASVQTPFGIVYVASGPGSNAILTTSS